MRGHLQSMDSLFVMSANITIISVSRHQDIARSRPKNSQIRLRNQQSSAVVRSPPILRLQMNTGI